MTWRTVDTTMTEHSNGQGPGASAISRRTSRRCSGAVVSAAFAAAGAADRRRSRIGSAGRRKSVSLRTGGFRATAESNPRGSWGYSCGWQRRRHRIAASVSGLPGKGVLYSRPDKHHSSLVPQSYHVAISLQFFRRDASHESALVILSAWPADTSMQCVITAEWPKLVFGPGTDPMSLFILLFRFLLGRHSSFKIGSGWNLAGCSSSKYASIDGVRFLIWSSGRRPRRSPAALPSSPPSACLQFLVYITLVLVKT